MTREEIKVLSKQYFDNNKSLQRIIGCSDGNFFYSDADASYHFAKNDLLKYVITREEINPHAPKTERELMFEEAALLNIAHPKNIKNIKLKELIESKKKMTNG